MKLGFSTLGSPAWTLEQVVDGASRYGFDGIELRMIRGEVELRKLPEFAPNRLEDARKLVRDAGLEVFCVDTSLRLGALAGNKRAEQLDEAETMFTIAQGLGAPYTRVFAGELEGRAPTQADFPLFREQLATFAELAQSFGVKVLLETHDTCSTGRSVADLWASGSSEIPAGVLWDVLQSYRHGESFAETLSAVGERTELVHIKDSGELSPDAFDLKLIGEGVIPIREAVAQLQARGYDGYLSLEWEKGWHPELEEPEVALPHYVQAMRRILSEVAV